MKRKFLQLITVLLTANVYAQTTVENFSYGTPTGTSADTLTNPVFGGSIWRRHAGTSGQVTYLGTSLNYAGYPSSGVGGSVGFSFTAAAAQDINRSTTPYTSGNVYISFLLSVSANGGMTSNESYFLHLMDTAFPTVFRARLHIRAGTTVGTFRIGLGKFSTSTPDSTADYPLNTPVLVVMKYGFYPGPLNDSVTAYVFTSGVPPTEPAVPTLRTPAADMANVSASDLAVVNAVAIRQHSGGIAGIIDGIRVSNTWANAPLPVQLTSFDATLTNDNTTILSWSTSSESDNSGFEIETSTDGIEFENIGFVKGTGNSNTLQHYHFKHANTKTAYYRLKQIDFNGEYTYSNTVTVKNAITEARLTPNPFNDNIEVTANSTIQKVNIVDLTGKVVISQNINNNATNINTKDLQNGIYFIKIYKDNEMVAKRIVKVD